MGLTLKAVVVWLSCSAGVVDRRDAIMSEPEDVPSSRLNADLPVCSFEVEALAPPLHLRGIIRRNVWSPDRLANLSHIRTISHHSRFAEKSCTSLSLFVGGALGITGSDLVGVARSQIGARGLISSSALASVAG
jgi:hypothetical protein